MKNKPKVKNLSKLPTKVLRRLRRDTKKHKKGKKADEGEGDDNNQGSDNGNDGDSKADAKPAKEPTKKLGKIDKIMEEKKSLLATEHVNKESMDKEK